MTEIIKIQVQRVIRTGALAASSKQLPGFIAFNERNPSSFKELNSLVEKAIIKWFWINKAERVEAFPLQKKSSDPTIEFLVTEYEIKTTG